MLTAHGHHYIAHTYIITNKMNNIICDTYVVHHAHSYILHTHGTHYTAVPYTTHALRTNVYKRIIQYKQ